MSNHYPHQNRYVPSKLLPTHYYREHHEFGIPFKRYPLNFDEHEESGYYIDFNQTHLVYAVPCTDITFSKKYNRDDLKNETIDTTAETRDTVGTTAARYHNNTHSRHYPHCAHSSHVQGFDVLTITKLMDYELQLHDVTPERLHTLFENFACPKRDTVVFEHVWMEQHKFLSRYFKVHKKPLLDYCLFRFPEPPVCPGPGPEPGEGPKVLSVIPEARYINPETCVTYVDLLVTFTQDVTPTVDDLKTIFSGAMGAENAQILNAVQTGPNTMLVTITFLDREVLYLNVDLTKVKNSEDITGSGIATVEVELGDPDDYLSVSYQDHTFDSVENTTTVWLAFATSGDNPPETQTEVAVSPSVNNEAFIKEKCPITVFDPRTEEGHLYEPDAINYVTHDGHPCVEFIYNQDFSQDDAYEITFTVNPYLFKYEDLLNYPDESFVLQYSDQERVISNYGTIQNQDGDYTGFWVIFPCTEDAVLSLDLGKITRAPSDDLDNTVNPNAYNLGEYVTEDVVLPGRKVYITFATPTDQVTPHTYYVQPLAIQDDTHHYNALWVTTFPNPEPPQPTQGPVLTNAWTDYDPQETLPAKIEAVFDQDIEIVDTSGIRVVYADASSKSGIQDLILHLSLTDYNTFIQDTIDFPNEDTSLPSAERLVDYYYGEEQVPGETHGTMRHPESGELWKNKTYFEAILPYINNSSTEQLAYINTVCFADRIGLGYQGYLAFALDYYADPENLAAMKKLIDDYAAANNLTTAQLLDGNHNTEAQGLRWLAEHTMPHYALWMDTDKTDSDFQNHINALYNEPLGGQTYPDDAIIATRSIVDALALHFDLTVSDLLTDVNQAATLRAAMLKADRGLAFIYVLTSACTETFMITKLSIIANNTQHDSLDVSFSYYPLDTNWILPTDITFNTSLTNLIMKFNNPNVRNRNVYVYIPQGAVRNPVSAYVNREGTKYSHFGTPEIMFTGGRASYTGATNKVTATMTVNNPLNFVGNLSDITITDGTNTAVATNVDLSNPRSPAIEFDNAAWAADKTITINIAQGVFENADDPTYSNDAYTADIYCSSDVPPTPATAPQIVSVSSTNNVGQDYSITLTFDQDIMPIDSTSISVTDGTHTTTGMNASASNNSITVTFETDYPTDWIASNPVTINIPADIVRESTNTVGNNAETLPNFVFGQAYPYPPQPVTNITVTFDSDGGSAVASQTIQSGTIPTRPTNPTKTNYTFDYWMLNGAQYNFDTALNANTTLTAHWTYVPPAPTPVAPTNQYPKKNGNNVSPIYVHSFGGDNSHLSLYLKYDTKVENGHSYIKLKDSSFKCEGNQAFFGWTIQTVRVKVGSTTVKELSNIYHTTSDTNWSEDFNTNWVDLGAVQTGTGAATLNVYAKSNSSGTYTGFDFNEDYNCTIAHNELV